MLLIEGVAAILGCLGSYVPAVKKGVAGLVFLCEYAEQNAVGVKCFYTKLAVQGGAEIVVANGDAACPQPDQFRRLPICLRRIGFADGLDMNGCRRAVLVEDIRSLLWYLDQRADIVIVPRL